ncbi:hypothetical protein O6H91_18G000500 [Diphasiastrum complanatum]|uniref:Uncharacterized protein n=1 Tax=Diphasiastrum complanatum TaxID=34168 RepID=A0ACC2AXF6_DIPCM|nr:hypothetical protein O6H91_18G000500 [Diphasiastrum complanatum]
MDGRIRCVITGMGCAEPSRQSKILGSCNNTPTPFSFLINPCRPKSKSHNKFFHNTWSDKECCCLHLQVAHILTSFPISFMNQLTISKISHMQKMSTWKLKVRDSSASQIVLHLELFDMKSSPLPLTSSKNFKDLFASFKGSSAL